MATRAVRLGSLGIRQPDGSFLPVDLDDLRGPKGDDGDVVSDEHIRDISLELVEASSEELRDLIESVQAGEGGSQHLQNIPSAVWTFAYEATVPPNVMVIDSTGSVVEPDLEFNIANKTIKVTFGGPVSGRALMS